MKNRTVSSPDLFAVCTAAERNLSCKSWVCTLWRGQSPKPAKSVGAHGWSTITYFSVCRHMKSNPIPADPYCYWSAMLRVSPGRVLVQTITWWTALVYMRCSTFSLTTLATTTYRREPRTHNTCSLSSEVAWPTDKHAVTTLPCRSHVVFARVFYLPGFGRFALDLSSTVATSYKTIRRSTQSDASLAQ